jgi:type I restriction enzyme S subunit
MNAWQEVKLKEICKFKYGSNLPASSRIEGNYPVYGSSSIVSHHIDYYVKGPGIIVGRKGTVGKVQYSPIDFFPIDTTFYIEHNLNKVDLKFLYYRLQISGLDTMNSDAAVPGLNRIAAINQRIDLPPLPTQRKIAKILSNYDDLIENNLKRIKLLEESARLTYEEWFLRFRIDGKKLDIDAATGLPFGWGKRKLTDVIKLNPLTKTEKGVEHPFIPMGSLSETNMVITDIEKRIPKGGTKFKNLDTLLARITPCLENGKTGFVQCLKDGEVATGSTEFIVMRATEVISPYYIYSLARTDGFREIAIQSMSGSDGRQRVKVKVFEKILLNIPDNEILHKYHLNMKAVFEEVQVLINQNQLLKEARDILLPRLMTGMIDTDELDIAV